MRPEGWWKAGTNPSALGRLLARPREVPEAKASQASAPKGQQLLGLDKRRDGLLYVPASYSAERPAPLVLMLHGAGGDALHALHLLSRFANHAGLILLAPASRRHTWDVIVDGYGPDVSFIDRALEQTFSRYSVDSARLAVGGFSDGASYALSLGLTNGDLFTHVIAFSPGYMAPASQQGHPRLFISHGTHDSVLPINACSRKLVPQVERAGYDTIYREFDGGHTVPHEIAREAVDWLAK
jgi:phospholipase/carboxylesterase